MTDQLFADYGQTVSEADSPAATTSFPNLFFPTLAEEKVRLASGWSNRQQQIRDRALAFAERCGIMPATSRGSPE